MGDQIEEFAPILWVTGTGRSGTNITKKIFSKHEEVATLPFETRFTIDPGGVVDFFNNYPSCWSPYRADALLKEFIAFLRNMGQKTPDSSRYPDWELEQSIPGYLKLVDELASSLSASTYEGRWPGSKPGDTAMVYLPPQSKEQLKPMIRKFLDGTTRAILANQGKSIFLDDNTWSLLYAKDLLDLYPNGKMLHIVRDPRDIIASLLHQRWAPQQLEDLIQWYKDVMSQGQLQLSQCGEARVLEIRFEDLVNDKRGILNKISSFIGIDCTDAMIETDLSQHHIGRFREEFTEVQQKHLSEALSEFRHYFYGS